ncbi:MAG: UDP-N-acetylmuramate dehydrogenase [Ruminococcaceae bacterium]|nr:UDP-N-acetylmuramate dehydrogenase [Oscillospiraceae bacterium]
MIGRFEEVLKNRKIAYEKNVPGCALSTFRIGGKIAYLLKPQCVGELITCVRICAGLGMPYAVIGKGSNILFDDGQMRFAVIATVQLHACKPLSKDRFWALCGTPMIKLSAVIARAGFSDLAFACGIPGSLGGALYMNAGAYGCEMSDVVESVEIYDPSSDKIETLFNKKLSYSYRKSVFQTNKHIILSAVLRLQKEAEPREVFARMRALNRLRRQKQPLEFPNAGSVFRRPSPEIAVAKMIDEQGLGGLRIGGAKISEKHTGFIVNTGGATAADVKELIKRTQKILEREYGMKPNPEICFLPEEI